MTLDGRTNRGRSNRLVLGNRHPQRVLHRILAITGGQLQNLQVFAGRHARRVIAQQPIVSHAEVTGGKHVGPIPVVLESPRLANQRVNHMAVVDGVLAVARQTRHRLNLASRPPDFNFIGVDHDIDLHADQATGNRIGVAADLNRAAAVNLDSADMSPMIELARRQLAEA